MTNDNNRQRREFGKFAEQLAVNHLMREGYVIREQNWRPKNSHLEVDVIAQRDDDCIVFVEVKARGLGNGDPLEAVDAAKRRKIARAADIYLRSQEKDYDYRFDIFAVEGDMDNYTCEYIEDAYISPLFGM